MDQEHLSSPPPLNPYEAPKSDLSRSLDPVLGLAPRATRMQRFRGSLIDSFLGLVTFVPILVGVNFKQWSQQPRGGNPFFFYQMAGPWGLLSGGLLLVSLAIQWTLIATRGQSVGKIAVGTRIFGLDEVPVGFARGVALRAWIPIAIGFVPVIGRAFSFIDILFIFRSDRRCLHDIIAGTQVLQVVPAPTAKIET